MLIQKCLGRPITIPGVQNPHWMPPFLRKDSWIGWSFSPSESPSIVTISFPWASMARRRHDATGLPSIKTLQAPYSPSLHDFFVPVNPRLSLRTSTSVLWGRTSNVLVIPFTFSEPGSLLARLKRTLSMGFRRKRSPFSLPSKLHDSDFYHDGTSTR